jgi:hypothetical protein
MSDKHYSACDEFPPAYVPEAEGICICGLLEQAREQEREGIRKKVQALLVANLNRGTSHKWSSDQFLRGHAWGLAEVLQLFEEEER